MYQGEKVRLRAVEEADIDQVMAWINDEAVTKYLSLTGQVTSRQSEQAYLARVSRGDDPTERVFTIETLGGEYLGSGGLHEIDGLNRHAELGIVIGRRDLHGRGYGTEAVRLLLQIAWQALNLQKVYLRVVSGNRTALRVYARCGFREAVRFRRHCFIAGAWHDDILMEIFREDAGREEGDN